MEATVKVARQRPGVLEPAEAIGNVSEARRQWGTARTQFSAYQRWSQSHGLAGPEDLPSIPKEHPHTTSPETVERILAPRLEHPIRAYDRLGAALQCEGLTVRWLTRREILSRDGHGWH